MSEKHVKKRYVRVRKFDMLVEHRCFLRVRVPMGKIEVPGSILYNNTKNVPVLDKFPHMFGNFFWYVYCVFFSTLIFRTFGPFWAQRCSKVRFWEVTLEPF